MRYYYFDPFRRQYYFPEEFQKYPLFISFYKPYKLIARITWYIWWNIPIIRYLGTTIHAEKHLPLNQITPFVPTGSVLAFNMGSEGDENKITVLGIDPTTNETFFIKYATNKIACLNVFNEGVILEQLSHLKFVPVLKLKTKVYNDFTLIITSVLQGEKIKNQSLNSQILGILFQLSEQKVKSYHNFTSGLLTCFAHGDFCPWNLLSFEGNINVFDWELAGNYHIGYDLFTFIFQYEFLINEKVRFEYILNENSDMIQQYFNHFNIDNWMVYLHEFAKLKYEFESEKNDKELMDYYLQLMQFAG
jgi:hypothetical protein